MKQITIIYLVGIYLIGMLRPIAPIIEYEINKGYISEFLCVNKEETDDIAICYGKCYLNKRLTENQKNNSNNSAIHININEYPIGFVEFLKVSLDKVNPTIEHNVSYCNIYKFSFSQAIYHPPIA